MPTVLPREAAVAALERRHDVRGQALVDLHRGLAEREVVGGEGRQLHRVLEQARAGGEARARQVGGARVVLADRAQDVRVVDAGLVGDHEELVRDRELHVAPGVGEQLGELGFLGRRADGLRGERPEQRRRRGRRRASSSAPMICGSEWSSSSAWPSAIRSGQKATSTLQPRLGEVLGDVAGRARVDGAAQDDQRARRAGAARSGRRPSRRSSSTGRGTRRPGVPMTTTRLSVRSIIEPSEPKLEPAGRRGPRARSSSAPVSMNGISPAAMRSSVAWLVS